jgi:hypothetical protein
MSQVQKDDNGKLRWDLLPLDVVEMLVEIYEFGANKYAENSWRTIENGYKRCRAALFRHLTAYDKGERVDPESGKSHLAHAAWNALSMVYFAERESENIPLQPKKSEYKLIIHRDKYGAERQLVVVGEKVFSFDAEFFDMHLSDKAKGSLEYHSREARPEEYDIAKEVLEYFDKHSNSLNHHPYETTTLHQE